MTAPFGTYVQVLKAEAPALLPCDNGSTHRVEDMWLEKHPGVVRLFHL